MFVVIATLEVKADRADAFLRAIQENARASLRDEPGCLRFDVLRSDQLPNRFLLYEIYVDKSAFEEQHRASAHYAVWRRAAAECVEDGTHVNAFYQPAFPEDIPEAGQLVKPPVSPSGQSGGATL